MRFRNVFLGVGSLLVILLLLVTDPDSGIITSLSIGSGVVATLAILVTAILYVGFLHLSRKALMDYIDLEQFFKKAGMTPEGSGLALIGVGLMMVSVSLVIMAAVN